MGWMSIVMLAIQLGKLIWQLIPVIRSIFEALRGKDVTPLLAAMQKAAAMKDALPLLDLEASLKAGARP